MTLGEITTTELILVMVTVGGGIRWWLERRDARSALSRAKSEADKTIKRWEETSADQEKTNAALREELKRKDERIAHLESLLYAGGSR